ncbi:MAG: tRNA lysidine(34) synthetase TilS [Pseudomonadota bacterium]
MNKLVAVAVSGGRDSIALLHCARSAAAALGIEVIALHVHHGLQADADAWAALVESTCERWKLRFVMRRLSGTPARGDSVEAWAREGRYAALAAMAREIQTDIVLLAQHRRDQAETFMLQALRAAGPAGLAAMPRQAARHGIVWARPWLDMPDEAIDAYARRHRLRFALDPSNADPRFARGRLRTQVMPALRQAFAQAEPLLAAAAVRCAEAQVVLNEVAQADLLQTTEGPSLRLAAWRELSDGRRLNTLRAWLREQLGQGAPQTLVARLMQELPGTGPAQWPCEGGTLRRYRGRLTVLTRPGPGASGVLRSTPVEEGGIALALLRGATWRPRSEGLHFQRAQDTPPRSLKKQFQAAGLAAWQRDVPLLFSADGRLLFVPGLGIDARVLAAPGEAQCALAWEHCR